MVAKFNRLAFALTVPASTVTLLVYVLPIIQVLALSFTDPKPGLENYQGLASSNAVWKVAATTINVSLSTTVLTVVGAYIVAFGLLHMTLKTRNIALLFVLVPFWISVLVRAFAWITVLRREGVINSILMEFGIIHQPLDLVYNRLGAIIGMVHYMMPFATLLLFANLSGIDQRIIQAARSLGARPRTIFFRIWIPLSMPAIVVSCVFVFIYSLGFLITPQILGAGRTVMVAEFIATQMSTLRWGVATALATVLLVICSGSVFLLLRRPAFRAAFEGRDLR